MTGNDVKQALRKLEFPYCAREALCRIGMGSIGYVVNDKYNSNKHVNYNSESLLI